jgi:SNF2 family DNA or RNA helicase
MVSYWVGWFFREPANKRTPIQNNVEELYSLFRFVRAKPLDDWNTFRDRIAKPVKSGQTKIAMKRLQVVLRAIMLRRAKDALLGQSM